MSENTLQLGQNTIVLDRSIFDVADQKETTREFTPKDVLKAIKSYNPYIRDSHEITVLNSYVEPLLEMIYLRIQ